MLHLYSIVAQAAVKITTSSKNHNQQSWAWAMPYQAAAFVIGSVGQGVCNAIVLAENMLYYEVNAVSVHFVHYCPDLKQQWSEED